MRSEHFLSTIHSVSNSATFLSEDAYPTIVFLNVYPFPHAQRDDFKLIEGRKTHSGFVYLENTIHFNNYPYEKWFFWGGSDFANSWSIQNLEGGSIVDMLVVKFGSSISIKRYGE